MPKATLIIVLAGGLILSLNMGVRQTFGIYLEPMTIANGWTVTQFSLAMAIQNVLWGLFTPFVGILADRFIGPLRMLIVGAVLYALGVVIMALADHIVVFNAGAGIIIGLGTGATGFPLVLAAVGRLVDEKNRSRALGMTAAGGSVGQMILPPLAQAVMGGLGWQPSLFFLVAVVLIMIPAAMVLIRPGSSLSDLASSGPTLGATAREASRSQGFWLLVAGFFVCGFHVAFVSVHLPAYIVACGLAPAWGGWSLAIIGGFNLIGTLIAGELGGRFPKKYLLSSIYGLRSVVIIVFLAVPPTELSLVLFSATFGMLWLSTVPLTSALVSHIFGPRFVATLFGVVMASHQIGAFFGAYLGGYLFDVTGGYEQAWNLAIALGIFAALIHLPIREVALRREAA